MSSVFRVECMVSSRIVDEGIDENGYEESIPKEAKNMRLKTLVFKSPTFFVSNNKIQTDFLRNINFVCMKVISQMCKLKFLLVFYLFV